jgi:hypothetical protein
VLYKILSKQCAKKKDSMREKKTISLPNNEEDDEPVGDGWLSLLMVTDTFEICM